MLPSSNSSSAAAAYKGKTSHRSWNNLPAEFVRLIVTHFLLDASSTSTGYSPQAWEPRDRWLHRMAYDVVRNANALENLMQVSPAWRVAIEHHLFWQHAASVFDPNDLFRHLQQNNTHRISYYKHFKYNIYERSCLVCRINYPLQSSLNTAKQKFMTHLGLVPCCSEHRHERFCGICLQDIQCDGGITENEDVETWPYIESTCRMCRAEWLWRVCFDSSAREREAIGGRRFLGIDWEARQAVETFVEIGEGNIREVILLAVEKWWLRKHTRIAEMMSLAIATSRMQARTAAEAYGSSDADIDADIDEEEDDDDDPDVMGPAEDAGARENAINDWARLRILDGFWVSPADQWHQRESLRQSIPQSYTNNQHLQPAFPLGTEFVTPYIRAIHPCSWTLTEEELNAPHPSPSIRQSSPPPSFNMCSTAHDAFKRQMRSVLFPAMRNIVRRVVIECAVERDAQGAVVDAGVRIAKMNVEDVLSALRESGVWFNGMDWAGARRRANVVDNNNDIVDENKKPERDGEDNDDLTHTRSPSSSESVRSSRASSKSGSQATSPVLSITTLQTTPSPPPRSDSSKKSGSVECEGEEGNRSDGIVVIEVDVDGDSSARTSRSTTATIAGGHSDTNANRSSTQRIQPRKAVAGPATLAPPSLAPIMFPIAISPVLESPTALPSIPFIPEGVEGLPNHSLDVFKSVWREAIDPLFKCRCPICERAVMQANLEAGSVLGAVPLTSIGSIQNYRQQQVYMYAPYQQTQRQPEQVRRAGVGVGDGHLRTEGQLPKVQAPERLTEIVLSEVSTETIEEEEGDDFDRMNVSPAGEVDVDELEEEEEEGDREEEEVRSDAPTLSSKGSDTEEGKGRRRWPPIRGEDYDDLSARLNAPTATKECVVPRIGTKRSFEVLQSADGGRRRTREEGDSVGDEVGDYQAGRGETPPKRSRIEEREKSVGRLPERRSSPSPSSSRMKRSGTPRTPVDERKRLPTSITPTTTTTTALTLIPTPVSSQVQVSPRRVKRRSEEVEDACSSRSGGDVEKDFFASESSDSDVGLVQGGRVAKRLRSSPPIDIDAEGLIVMEDVDGAEAVGF